MWSNTRTLLYLYSNKFDPCSVRRMPTLRCPNTRMNDEWCWRWKRGQVSADVPVIYSVMEKWLEEIKEAEKDVWKK